MNIIRTAFVALFILVGVSLHAQVTVKYSSDSGDPGAQVTIEVRTDNFTDIASMQFSTNWNDAVLEYVSVQDFNSTLGLNESLFGTPDNLGRDDAVTVTWFDVSLEGVTLPANTLLFSITFEIVGSGGQQSSLVMSNSPTTISFQDGNGAVVDASFLEGTVTVNGMGGGDDMVELIGSQESGGSGSSVCVQISVNGFSEIFSAQWNHTYNNNVLDFTGIQNINLDGLNAGLFNVNETTGEIRMSYVAPPPSATVADGTVIYELCFDIIGSSGSISQVDFTALLGNPIEIIQIQNGMDVQVTPDITDGSVTVTNVGGPDDLILTFPEIEVDETGTICVPVNAQNINDIQAIQNLAFFWDPAVLEYTGVQNENLCGAIPTDLTLVETKTAQGELSIFYVYVDPSDGSGCTVADAPFFEICFNIIGACDDVSPLTFGSSGGQVLLFNSQGNALAYSTNEGSVTIACASCEPGIMVTDATCKGSTDGRIVLDLSECPDVTNVNPSIEDLQSLGAGSYDVTVTYNNGDDAVILEDIVVGEPDMIVAIEMMTITPDCDGSGGAIDIEISGIIGTAEYSWSTGENTQDIEGVRCQDEIRVTITDSENPTCVRVFGPFEIPCAPAVTGVETNVTCAGDSDGAVDITVTGGSGDFSYDWSCAGNVNADGDISGLDIGSCTVTVTDNSTGCAVTESFDIVEPDPLVIISSIVTEDTAGLGTGSISIVVNGGTGDYTYVWSVGGLPNAPDVDGLTGGMYSVVVFDENDCTISMDFDVPTYIFLGGTGEVTDPLCFGEQNGMIILSTFGGRPDYTYEWSCPGDVASDGTISGVGAGTCTVTITDSEGATFIETFDVFEPDQLSATITVEEICEDVIANASIDIEGGTGSYSVEWNTNPIQFGTEAFDLDEGPLSAIVIDANDCETSASAEVAPCVDPSDCYKGMQVITPNNDGINEVFVILCIDNFPNRLQIFNEQGQLVYTADNYQNDWNGVDSGGNEVIDDAYMWVLEIFLGNGDKRIEEGTVTVLRQLK